MVHDLDAQRAGARDDLDELIYQDLRLRLPELLLMRVDKLTMANAIEARVPFLDHEVVELAMAMPAAEKIRGAVGKHVLKRVVADLLPHGLGSPWLVVPFCLVAGAWGTYLSTFVQTLNNHTIAAASAFFALFRRSPVRRIEHNSVSGLQRREALRLGGFYGDGVIQ